MSALSEEFNKDWLEFKTKPDAVITIRSLGSVTSDGKEIFPTVELDQADLNYPIHNDLLHEWHKEDGEIHRVDGPAIIIRDPENPEPPLFEGWYRHGKLHREDGPAITRRKGACLEQEWWQNDVLHRENGPAELWLDENGAEKFQRWSRNGVEHRDDGPAYISKDTRTGVEHQEIWIKNGEYHRIDGPAFILRDPVTGQVTQEQWRREGKPFRQNGPATICGHAGQKPYLVEDYFLNGVPINPPRELDRIITPKGPKI